MQANGTHFEEPGWRKSGVASLRIAQGFTQDDECCRVNAKADRKTGFEMDAEVSVIHNSHLQPLGAADVRRSRHVFGLDRGYFRILPVFLSLVVGSGCASFSNRPTNVMVQSLLATERKVVTFTLAGAPEAIEQQITQRAAACVEGVLKSSGVVPAGPGVLVPVSSFMRQWLEEGMDADGSHWLALRMDGLIHAVAFGLRLGSQEGGSVEIKAFPADHRKPDRIKELVASGEIFCAWREVSYPYD